MGFSFLFIQTPEAKPNSGYGKYDLMGVGHAFWTNFTDLSGQFNVVAFNNNTKNGYVGNCASIQVSITVPSYASFTTWVGPNSTTKTYTLSNFQYGQTNTTARTVSKTFNGTYPSISFSATYKNGSKYIQLFSGRVTFTKDGSAPTLRSVADNACYRVGQNVSHTWTCSDSGSGCQSGSYTGWGTGTISVGASDNTCNTSGASFTPNRDGTPPSRIQPVLSTSACTRELTLYGRCLQDGGGCAGCGYDLNNGVITANGTYHYAAQDGVGNQSSSTVTINTIDRIPPSCTGITKPDNNYWYRTNFDVSSSCSDTGCAGCVASKFTESKNTSSGNITIRDTVGNTTSCPYDSVKVDTSKPTTTIAYGPAYTQMNDKLHASDTEVEVLIEASDTQAGVDRVCYSLSGATTKGDTCENGDNTKVYIANEGNTTVTAWSYDKARDYNANTNSGSYDIAKGGNRSDNVNKVVYVDRTAPNIEFTSTNDGKTWSNKATPVTITLKDGGSGVSYYDYYWSTSNSDAYDTSSALDRTTGGNIVHTDMSDSWVSNKAFIETNPTNMAHNDVIYLHVKACDRSFYTNNCSTATYTTGIHFDNLKPMAPEVDKMEQEWVNKFSLKITTNEHVQTGKQHSGLSTIFTYWDENEKHKEEGMSRENSTYSKTANLTNSNPKNKYNPRYNWTLNFKDLKHMLTDGEELSAGACEEGSRFIKICVSDIAGNESEFLVAGPYKWDTTNPYTELVKMRGDERTFLPADAQK